MIRGSWDEAVGGEEVDQVFVIFVVCLFYAITAASDLCEFACKVFREV